MPYWKIEPYHNTDADYYVMEADTEDDHREALKYAQERLESQWDQCVEGEGPRSVSIELCAGDFYGEDEED